MQGQAPSGPASHCAWYRGGSAEDPGRHLRAWPGCRGVPGEGPAGGRQHGLSRALRAERAATPPLWSTPGRRAGTWGALNPRGRRRPRPLHWPRCTLSLHGEGAPPHTHRNQQAGLGATGHRTASRVTLRVWPARLRPTRGWPLVACDCGCPCQTGACVPTRGPAEQGGPGFGLGRWVGRSRSDLVRPKVNVTSEHRGPWEAEGCTWSPQSKVHREPIEGRGAYEKVSPLGGLSLAGKGPTGQKRWGN